MDKQLCFYHGKDFDGKCSGAIVAMFNPNVELYPIDHGDPFPWNKITKDMQVIMVDFSLKAVDMLRLADACSHFVWIDHHKSALDDVTPTGFLRHPNVDYRVVIGKSGCELTWEHYSKDSLPTVVHYLGRYDVHDEDAMNKNPNIMAFQFGLNVRNTGDLVDGIWPAIICNSGRVDKILDANTLIRAIIEDGKVIKQYYDNTNREIMARNAGEATIEGLKCIWVDHAYTQSMIFDSIWDRTKYDAMFRFNVDKTGAVVVSMYTDKPGVDVSVVCKKFGGGGHVGAAGFRTTLTELAKILPLKK